jgi:aerobic carbon-monoxide dehydrogenase small subunit
MLLSSEGCDMMKLTFTVNERKVEVMAPPDRRLVDILRADLKLTGTKIGCGEGECGACTVIMNDLTVNSCLVPACQLEGAIIVTIEGLESTEIFGRLKKAFLEKGAVQCGYCTPGFILSAFHLLSKKADPSSEEIREALSGNLCRCTGYVKIFQAVEEAKAQR